MVSHAHVVFLFFLFFFLSIQEVHSHAETRANALAASGFVLSPAVPSSLRMYQRF